MISSFVCLCSDPSRHSVGSVLSDGWRQRADPDGHWFWSCSISCTSPQPSGGQSSGEALFYWANSSVFALCLQWENHFHIHPQWIFKLLLCVCLCVCLCLCVFYLFFCFVLFLMILFPKTADSSSEGSGQYCDGDRRADTGCAQLRRPLSFPQPAHTP